MNTISLQKFIETGVFGTVSIGMQAEEVMKILGHNYEFAHLKQTQILKYGGYEFFYHTHNQKLFAIQNDSFNPDTNSLYDLESNLIVLKYDLWERQKLAYLNTIQEKLQIAFEIRIDNWNEDSLILEIKYSKVCLHFHQENKEYILNAIRLFDK